MFEPEFTREYIQRVLQDPEAYAEDFCRIRDASVEDRKIYKGALVPMTYQGFFIEPEQVAFFSDIISQMARIGRKVTAEFLANPDYRQGFRLSPDMERLILLDPGYHMPVPVGRYDIFYNGGQDFIFNEFNTDGSSAMNEDLVLGQVLADSRIFKEMEADWTLQPFELFDSLVTSMTQHYARIRGQLPMNVAIVDFMDKGTLAEFEKFHATFEKQGYNCIIADPRDMRYAEGRLWGHDPDGNKDIPIDLVYRRVVTADFLDRIQACQDFLQAYEDQAFVMIGSFRSQIMHSKLIFSVLRSEASRTILTPEEWAFVQDHVPETWPILQEADKDRLLAQKDQYVVKPYNGYGAKGVSIGREMSQAAWEARIRELPLDVYCAQQFIAVDRTPVLDLGDQGLEVQNMGHVLGLYLYGEQFAGLYCRLGKGYQISSEGQYYTAPAFVVERKAAGR